MASIKKRGDAWRVWIEKSGIRETRTFDTKSQAQHWALKRETEIAEGERGIAPKKTLAEAFQRYADEVSVTKRGAKWEQVRLKMFARVMDFSNWQICAVDAATLAKWRDVRLKEVAPGTVRREMNLVNAVLEVARKEWGWIALNALKDVRKPPTPPHRKRRVSEDEIERICFALGYADGSPVVTVQQQVAVAFLLAIETAMRSGEMLGLEWRRVDLKRRFVTLEETKNGDSRDVPLSTRAVALLSKMAGIDKVRVFTVDDASRDALFRKAKDHAEVEGLRFHDSRAEALTRLSQKLDVLELARMTGHRDTKSLMIYYRKSAEDIAKRLD